MRSVPIFQFIFLVLFAGTAFSEAPKVKEANGVYSQKLQVKGSSGEIGYIVDVQTRICLLKWFSKGGSPTRPVIIDCASLANRDEWKAVITWVGQ